MAALPPYTLTQVLAAAQDDMNALHFAATKGNVEVIQFLLRPGEHTGVCLHMCGCRV